MKQLNGKLTNLTRDSRPRRQSSGFGLEAALNLSDGTSSIVVLQGGSGAWTRFLPSVLVGQRTVVMLRQNPGEQLEALCERVSKRMRSADYPTHRLLWVTPPDTSEESLERVRPRLMSYCDAGREVLLVSGQNVELIAAELEGEAFSYGPMDVRRADSRDTRLLGLGGRYRDGAEPGTQTARSDVHWECPEGKEDIDRPSRSA